MMPKLGTPAAPLLTNLNLQYDIYEAQNDLKRMVDQNEGGPGYSGERGSLVAVLVAL